MPTERYTGIKLQPEGDVLTYTEKLAPASLKLQTKAGTPADADIVGGAADGDIVVDTTNSLIYVRIGGTWKKTGALT